MILQAKRNKGDSFTSEDELQVQFIDVDLSVGAFPIYSIEVVSGVAVTHGGGALAGDFLNYSEDTSIVPTLTMKVEQVAKGTSIIKVVVRYSDDAADFLAHASAVEAYDLEYNLITDPVLIPEYNPPEYVTNYITIKTGAIELEWGDDVFV